MDSGPFPTGELNPGCVEFKRRAVVLLSLLELLIASNECEKSPSPLNEKSSFEGSSCSKAPGACPVACAVDDVGCVASDTGTGSMVFDISVIADERSDVDGNPVIAASGTDSDLVWMASSEVNRPTTHNGNKSAR